MAYRVDPDLMGGLAVLQGTLNSLSVKAAEEGLELMIEVTPVIVDGEVANSFRPYFNRRIYVPVADAPTLEVAG